MTATPVLVLDLDGTLIETLPDLAATLNMLLVKNGHAAIPPEDIRAMVGQGARVMLQRGFAHYGVELTQERTDELFAEFLEHYQDHIAEGSHPFPGVLEQLDRFAAAGWKLAVCTNKLEVLSKKLLDALGVSSRFAVIAGPDTFGYHKPDPNHILKTVEAAGGVRENAVMVGDSVADINAAKGAGIPVVAVDFGYTPIPVSELDPNIIISHFDQLWDAVESVRAKV
ncbi:MAG: phosphoglycolate phosphatase [Hyphomicrobiales bacterium]|nr:MAG: phosphoglycolate phosphatase [Hyphomicrobiales bacterium]